MALFRLCSDITIGSFRFAGVNEVRIRRSLHTLADSATIRLPSMCRISAGKSKSAVVQTTGTLFKDSDAVTINLGYNDNSTLTGGTTPVINGNNNGLGTEFMGFVKRRNLNMPLEVECEGYSYALRQCKISGNYSNSSVNVGELLNQVASAANSWLSAQGLTTTITVSCPVQYQIKGFSLTNTNGVEVCEFIQKSSAGTLTICFITPTTLWCGLVYTALAGGTNVFELPQVSYELGYNVVKDNGLRERIPSDPVQVILNGKLATGEKVFTASKFKAAKRQLRHLANHAPDNGTLSAFAQEKEYHHNYIGYEGNINAFLQPFCWPGWQASIIDDRYPERNGVYIIEGTEVSFGQHGARRQATIGPLLNFGTTYLNALNNG